MPARPHAPRQPIDPTVPAADVVVRQGADILTSAGMDVERACVQHGTTSVFEHSVAVTGQAVRLAQALALPVHERELVRGALLHDYFLYDWHVADPSHRLHGLRHPFTARRNATRDFGIGRLERNMILTHMFPLVPLVPTSREGWLLTLADKHVATLETLSGILGRLGGAKGGTRA